MVLGRRFKLHWLQVVAHVGALLPLGWLLWQAWQDLFLVDPVREITTFTGQAAIILLLLSLACTPLNTVTGYKPFLRLSRPLGLYAFMYASLHFATFVGLDYGFDLALLGGAIFEQRYVVVGFAAGLILLALAITSTRAWQSSAASSRPPHPRTTSSAAGSAAAGPSRATSPPTTRCTRFAAARTTPPPNSPAGGTSDPPGRP